MKGNYLRVQFVQINLPQQVISSSVFVREIQLVWNIGVGRFNASKAAGKLKGEFNDGFVANYVNRVYCAIDLLHDLYTKETGNLRYCQINFHKMLLIHLTFDCYEFG